MRNDAETADIRDTVARYQRGLYTSAPGAENLVAGARIDAYTQGNFDARCGLTEPPSEFAEYAELLVEWQRGHASTSLAQLDEIYQPAA
ncbi:hypothetical protein [Massilia sp. TS11]|uniref:hypothetical protein n=1 Tax=Massilia sp. TS11 TaxID=2908003 RepID=UPI001EDA6CEE|nr:hypothetical protein [Massilia sp. TS11]MCG2583866.1 hypothetical protein [Massilia sp. TS11]